MTKSKFSKGRKRRTPVASTSSSRRAGYAAPLSRAQERHYTRWASKMRSKIPRNPATFNPAVDAFDPINLPQLEEAVLGSSFFQQQCSHPTDGKKWASALNEVVGNTTFIFKPTGACALSGFRVTAALAAELAGEEDSDGMGYCTFYCGGFAGSEEFREPVLEEMKKLGWDPIPPRNLCVTVKTAPGILAKLREDDEYVGRFLRTLLGTAWENEDSIFSKPEFIDADDAAALVAWARNESCAVQYKLPALTDRKDVVVYSDVRSDLGAAGYSPKHNLYPTVDVDEDPAGEARVSDWHGGMDAYLRLCAAEDQ